MTKKIVVAPPLQKDVERKAKLLWKECSLHAQDIKDEPAQWLCAEKTGWPHEQLIDSSGPARKWRFAPAALRYVYQLMNHCCRLPMLFMVNLEEAHWLRIKTENKEEFTFTSGGLISWSRRRQQNAWWRCHKNGLIPIGRLPRKSRISVSDRNEVDSG